MTTDPTDLYIQLLKDDNQPELDKFYNQSPLQQVNFNKVYQAIHTVENNSSVYNALGLYYYGMGNEFDDVKSFYYWIKAGDNIHAKDNLNALMTFRSRYSDDNPEHVDFLKSIKPMIEKLIKLEVENQQLIDENTHLKYMPSAGYQEAQDHFESLQ